MEIIKGDWPWACVLNIISLHLPPVLFLPWACKVGSSHSGKESIPPSCSCTSSSTTSSSLHSLVGHTCWSIGFSFGVIAGVVFFICCGVVVVVASVGDIVAIVTERLMRKAIKSLKASMATAFTGPEGPVHFFGCPQVAPRWTLTRPPGGGVVTGDAVLGAISKPQE